MRVKSSTIQQLEKDKPKSRCRKWRLWVTTDDGRKSRRFTGTYTQAQDALKDFVSELEAFMPNSDTFASYAESWRSWRKESGEYSPNTLAGDSVAINALMRTELSDMRMDTITPESCRDALVWLKSHPSRGEQLKPSTLAKVHQVLNAILAQAADDGKIASNPMAHVKRPRIHASEKDALTPDELQLFLNRLDEMPLDGRVMAVYLMACLGLRCGEACALRDDEVDSRYACITSTVRAADNTIGRTKSNAGNRVLPMPPRLHAKVEQWRELRDALGLHDAETLCCNLRGNPLSTSAVSNWWRGGGDYAGARSKLGCDGMTLHELRHSNLSMMARHMSPFDLQRYAGWSSIAPAKIYIHEDLDAVSRAVELAWK